MKRRLIAVPAITIGLFMTYGVALAQSPEVILPSAGLTPENPFYFLDRLEEEIQQFLTFDLEAKARLQIEFASERIAEIEVLVEKSEPNGKGIEKARELLLGNVAYAAELINQEKASGKDVASLAKDLDDEFDAREKLLTKTFLAARERLLVQRKEIKDTLLKDAQAAGDTQKIAELTKELIAIENQILALKDTTDVIKKDFRIEKEKIEQEMDLEDQKEDTLEQHQEDKEDQADLEEQELEEEIEVEEPAEVDEPEEAAEIEETEDAVKAEEEQKDSQAQEDDTEESE